MPPTVTSTFIVTVDPPPTHIACSYPSFSPSVPPSIHMLLGTPLFHLPLHSTLLQLPQFPSVQNKGGDWRIYICIDESWSVSSMTSLLAWLYYSSLWSLYHFIDSILLRPFVAWPEKGALVNPYIFPTVVKLATNVVFLQWLTAPPGWPVA